MDKEQQQQQQQANSQRSKRKKRQRQPVSESDLVGVQQERYDRLLYTANKQIHKQAKQVKNFLVQKEIRKQQQPKENEKVATLKNVDLDLVTQQALRQLGLYHCNPSLKMAVDDDSEEEEDEEGSDNDSDGDVTPFHVIKSKPKATKSTASIPASLPPSNPNHAIVAHILTHKRFLQTMEDWNAKVAEYRQWCLSLEAKRDHTNDYLAESNRRKNKKRRQKANGNSNGTANANKNDYYGPGGHQHNNNHGSSRSNGGDPNGLSSQEPSAMFFTLGGEGDIDGHDDDDMTGGQPKKKNRMGQRARKAKAMAIEAKRLGKTDYVSQNWRAPKAHKPETEDGDSERTNHQNRSRNSRNQETTRSFDKSGHNPSINTAKSEQQQSSSSEPVHASWAAKQAQKTGIVAFQGKKITFD
ncbi:MAG: hypothetical protein SGILL_001359 [Bacillariaceae sp.]